MLSLSPSLSLIVHICTLSHPGARLHGFIQILPKGESDRQTSMASQPALMDTLKMMDRNTKTTITDCQRQAYRQTMTVLLILWIRAVHGEGHELVFRRL